MQTLANKTYLVTGAGGGIGSAIALALGQAGATVVLVGRSLPALEKTYDAIQAVGGPEPALFPMDFATAVDDQFETLAAAIRVRLGHLDGIIHAASAYLAPSPLHQQSSAEWLEQFRVNAVAPCVLNQACAGLLRRAPDAPVILIGETHGATPAAYWGGFAVAKAALEAYFRIQAAEWHAETALRLHLVIPGPIRSPQRALSHPGEDKSSLPTCAALASDLLTLIERPDPAWRGQRLNWRPGRLSVTHNEAG
jgi:NAD(P)-dependent dehydrogenase (short-subunit alcohol dehydrogenase family)